MEEDFYKKFKKKVHELIMFIYDATEKFPKSEIFGTTSQIRRSAVSIMLNYTEGFARIKPKVKQQFFEIAYGSTKETKYLLFLAFERKWIDEKNYQKSFKLIDEIGAMMWSMVHGIKKKNDIA